MAVVHTRQVDDETRRASAFFDAVALWPRDDLDRHIGDRREGAWILTVTRPTTTLYVVVLRTAPDSAAGRFFSREILRTDLFRPEPASAS